jgi:hypothetical protein
VLGMELLHQEPEIEAGRSAADAYDPHVSFLCSVSGTRAHLF